MIRDSGWNTGAAGGQQVALARARTARARVDTASGPGDGCAPTPPRPINSSAGCRDGPKLAAGVREQDACCFRGEGLDRSTL
jgi:hypothetical protein